MSFNTYIDDRAMIPVLLAHDWMVWKDTWTDCHYETYMALKKMMRHNGNAVPMVQHLILWSSGYDSTLSRQQHGFKSRQNRSANNILLIY